MLKARLFSSYLAIAALGACQCGVEGPKETDSGEVVSGDAGALDSSVADARSPDADQDDSAQASDSSTQDVASPDLAAPDMAVADVSPASDAASGRDAVAADAAVADVVATADAIVADATPTDTDTLDAFMPDSLTPDVLSFDAEGDHAPIISAQDPLGLYPGELAVLSGSFIDFDLPGDTHSFLWEPVAGSLPTGVALIGATTQTPTISVDRSIYQSGPEDLLVQLRFTVTDSTALFDSAVLLVTILDERGPHVSNLSPYSGTGPVGYCGAQGRPCSTIEDALVNLRGAIGDGASYGPSLLIATTGTTYLRDEEILLDGTDGIALGLSCGYDPSTWERQAGQDRTPIHFTSANGVLITADGVRVEGCDIVGADLPSPLAQRIAIWVNQAQAEIVDNRLRANVGAAEDANIAYGLYLHAADATTRSLAQENDIAGGLAETTAVGVAALDGIPDISDNLIEGGSANTVAGMELVPALVTSGQRATLTGNTVLGGAGGSTLGPAPNVYGVYVDTGNPVVSANTITGGNDDAHSPLANVGLHVNRTDDTHRPLLTGNTITGYAAGAAPADVWLAWGIVAASAVDLQDNLRIEGGRASIAVGFQADDGATFSSTNDVIVGGQALDLDLDADYDFRAIGAKVDSGASGSFVGSHITGVPASATAAYISSGLDVSGASVVTVTDGSVSAGPAMLESIGIDLTHSASAVTVTGTVVSAAAASDPAGGSLGIAHRRGALTVIGAAVSSGPAFYSYAVYNAVDSGSSQGAGPSILTDVTAVAGAGDGYSMALHHRSGQLTLSGGSYQSGDSPDGLSRAAELAGVVGDLAHSVSNASFTSGSGTDTHGFRATAVAGTLELAGNTFTAGAATGAGFSAASIGLELDGGEVTIDGDTATGGTGPLSYGAVITNLALDATDLSATGGVATNRSEGIKLSAAAGSRFTGGEAIGGEASNDSLGLRVEAGESDVRFSNMTIRGSLGNTSTGALIEDGCDACIWYGSTIEAGGGEESSVGMWAKELQGGGLQNCVVAGGPIPGGGARSIGLYTYHAAPFAIGQEALMTYVFNSRISGGAAADARGVDVNGNPDQSLRFFYNIIDGGGVATDGVSYGIYVGSDILPGGTASIGVFVGNIINPGVGATGAGASAAYHIWEGCVLNTGDALPSRAANNNFLPAPTWPSAAYVARNDAGSCGTPTLLTTIAQVNATSPYDAAGAGDESYDVDPSWDADGYHLLVASPLIDKALEVPAWTPTSWVLFDIDDEARPAGAEGDIGVDEHIAP